MLINGVTVVDTFAEAFAMFGARVLITAENEKWAAAAARTMTGFATSVIGCKCEAGIERVVPAGETPDGRPGVMVLLFATSADGVGKREERHQMTCDRERLPEIAGDLRQGALEGILSDAVAKAAGLPGLILHGTATLALAVSQVVRHELASDPTRVREVAGRLTGMVLMPSEIRVRCLSYLGNVIAFDVVDIAGDRVLSDGRLAV